MRSNTPALILFFKVWMSVAVKGGRKDAIS